MSNKQSKSGLMLLLGAIFGAIAALFLSTDKDGRTKKAVRTKVKDTKKLVRENLSRDKMVEIFGEDSEKYFDAVEDMRAKAGEQLAKLQKAGEKIDTDKYLSIATDLVDKFKQKAKVTPEQIKKITTYLANDLKKLKNSNDAEDEA